MTNILSLFQPKKQPISRLDSELCLLNFPKQSNITHPNTELRENDKKHEKYSENFIMLLSCVTKTQFGFNLLLFLLSLIKYWMSFKAKFTIIQKEINHQFYSNC